MPATLLDRIDTVADDHGYTGRSEVLRDASRTLLSEMEHEHDRFETVVATVTVLAQDGESLDVPESPSDSDALVETLRTPVAEGCDLSVFVLDGRFEEITAFVERVRADRDTLRVDHATIPVEPVVPVR